MTEEADSARALLSAESLQQIPDVSQNRLEITASQIEPPDRGDAPDTDDEQLATLEEDEQIDDTPAAIQHHLEQRESFRRYMMSFSGAESVYFYRRYGSWNGHVNFTDGAATVKALNLFDAERFPSVKIHQSSNSSNKLKFAASNAIESSTQRPSRQSTADSRDREDAQSVASVSMVYDHKEEWRGPILTVPEIPNLRKLYRSRRLLQRDQSFNPNDSYNRMISLCYHDLTRLKVDAIVNSANATIAYSDSPGTLTHIIQQAAGPGLQEEAKSKGKIKPGQVELTHGHDLPCAW